jgi:trigger factor
LDTTLTDAGPFEKVLTLHLDDAQLDTAKERAARRLSKDLRIPGFRPGKAPRRVVEATVGADRLRSEAIEDVLPEVVTTALADVDLSPAVAPSVETMRDVSDGVEVEVKVTVWPELEEVPSYRHRRIEVTTPEVSEQDLDEQITRLRRQFAELETASRPATEGDFVSINLSASHLGQELPEASATDLLYEVGSGSFVQGLDDVLPGKSAGEIVSFIGPLPSGFGDRAGQDVDFRALVKEVRRVSLPELTDQWVSEVTEFENVEELRSDLQRRLAAAKRSSARAEFRSKVVDALLGEMDLQLPEALVSAEMDRLLHRFVHRLESQGISLADYFKVTGIERDAFLEDLRRQAERSLHTDVLLDAVARDEGVAVSEEELSQAVSVLAENAEDPEAVRSALDEGPPGKALRSDILRQKALERLEASAIPVDEMGSPLDLAPTDETSDGAGPEGADIEDEEPVKESDEA